MVNFVVGGLYHSICEDDISNYPDSYFARVIKDEWSDSSPIVINRDGQLFTYIASFMHTDSIQISHRKRADILALLVSIRTEADYYNLPELAEWCEYKLKEELPHWCSKIKYPKDYDSYECQWEGSTTNDLTNIYVRNFFPSVLTGDLNDQNITGNIFMSSKVGDINVREILEFQRLRRVNSDVNMVSGHYLPRDGDLERIEWLLPTIPNIFSSFGERTLFVITKRDQKHIPGAGPTRFTELGNFFFILQAPEAGGAISVTQNGVTSTISGPGEYIMCSCDSHRTVQEIVSGELVYLRFDVELPYAECGYIPSDNKGCETLSPELATELISAAHGELENAESVVLCLSKLYPITSFDPTTKRLGTDCEALEGRDALLYAVLEPHFDVTLVAVYIQRYKTEVEGCVIGSAPVGSAKVKIVTPPYGFGELWEEHQDGGSKFAVLFTGLYLCAISQQN